MERSGGYNKKADRGKLTFNLILPIGIAETSPRKFLSRKKASGFLAF